MDVAGWRGGTTDLCPGRQKPSRRQWDYCFMMGDAVGLLKISQSNDLHTSSEFNFDKQDQ